MSVERNFIEPEIFERFLSEVPKAAGGGAYKDSTITAAYGDMSRLVVALLACATQQQLDALYHDLGWKGGFGGRQMHMAAKQWFNEYYPGRELPSVIATIAHPADRDKTAGSTR